MLLEDDLVKACKDFAVKQIESLGDKFEYHSVAHTLSVLNAVNILAESEKLSDKDWRLVQIAALFHDVGFVRDIVNHEAASIWMMGDFLKYKMKPSEIVTIEHLILTTAPGVVPMNLSEQIIKDADLSYLGTRSFEEIGNMLRNEWANTRQLSFSDEHWLKMNIRFLQETNYYTRTAEQLFGAGKNANLEKLQSRLKA